MCSPIQSCGSTMNVARLLVAAETSDYPDYKWISFREGGQQSTEHCGFPSTSSIPSWKAEFSWAFWRERNDISCIWGKLKKRLKMSKQLNDKTWKHSLKGISTSWKQALFNLPSFLQCPQRLGDLWISLKHVDSYSIHHWLTTAISLSHSKAPQDWSSVETHLTLKLIKTKATKELFYSFASDVILKSTLPSASRKKKIKNLHSNGSWEQDRASASSNLRRDAELWFDEKAQTISNFKFATPIFTLCLANLTFLTDSGTPCLPKVWDSSLHCTGTHTHTNAQLQVVSLLWFVCCFVLFFFSSLWLCFAEEWMQVQFILLFPPEVPTVRARLHDSPHLVPFSRQTNFLPD